VRFIILRSAGSPDSPGVGETFERHAQAERVSADDFLSDVTRRTMLGRLPTVPEVAEAAALMASDRASAMTGVMANVTSGFWVDV
jgi:3-oxoacyl-[acyl-carrier protein] reductase